MILPSNLPTPAVLKSNIQALAALDAVFSPEWEYRYYSFDTGWSDAEQMGSIRNGSGDDVFVLFNVHGCFLKGFAHEYPNPSLQQTSFYEDVPLVFQDAAREPAFSPENVSFCFWKLNDGQPWQSSVDEKKLNPEIFFLLQGLSADPAHYAEYVSDYFEAEGDKNLIAAILRGDPISERVAKSLNPEIDFSELMADLDEIGFPIEE